MMNQKHDFFDEHVYYFNWDDVVLPLFHSFNFDYDLSCLLRCNNIFPAFSEHLFVKAVVLQVSLFKYFGNNIFGNGLVNIAFYL